MLAGCPKRPPPVDPVAELSAYTPTPFRASLLCPPPPNENGEEEVPAGSKTSVPLMKLGIHILFPCCPKPPNPATAYQLSHFSGATSTHT